MRFINQFSIFVFLFTVGSLSISNAQKKEPASVNVTKTSEISTPLDNCLTYTLPKTVIKVEIETEKTIKKTGPFYRYSERFLSLTNVITEDKESWSIKGIKVTTYGTPDPEQRYSISSTGESAANFITLTPSGILKGINTPTPYKSKCYKKDHQNYSDIKLEDVNFDNIAYNQDLLLKTSSAAMAQEAANMIYQIRADRKDLLSGAAENLPPDGEAYKTVLQELDNQEKDFISLFAGKTITVKHTQTFELIPDPLSSYNNYVICRFSEQNGVLDPMDITGTPIYFSLDNKQNMTLNNTAEEDPKKPQQKGLFYCLPGEVSISVKDKTTEIYKSELSIAQYGKKAYLPASLLTNENISILFDPRTGALISISK